MTNQNVEEFIAMFNRVEKAIREELGMDKHIQFGMAIRQYDERRPSWGRVSELKVLGNLRNLLVHDHVIPSQYSALPSQTSMQTLRQILEDLEHPVQVIPRFRKSVRSVEASQSLNEVLSLIREADFSQFPVDDDGTFKGLLTENGVVRYLANYGESKESIIDFANVSVRSLLREDENRKNYVFIDHTERLDVVLDRFAQQPVLEAALITANGRKDEKLLGIITRWDALEARKEI